MSAGYESDTTKTIEAKVQNRNSEAPDNKGGKNKNKRRRNRSQNRKPHESNGSNSQTAANSSQKNDPTYYNKYPEILNSAARINNYHPLGLMGQDMFGVQKNQVIPGILNMDVLATLPVSSSADGVMQQAAYQTWTKVRDAISGTRSYDPVDLQVMQLATVNALACNRWLRRFFNFAFTMSPTNRYTPKALFTAMHLNYDDFINNLPSYRARFNRLTINLSRIFANLDSNFYKLMMGVFSGVLMEPGMNGQLYTYSPVGFYKYNWNADSHNVKVGGLKFVSIYSGGSEDASTYMDPLHEDCSTQVTTMDKFLNMYQQLINALINDSDVNTMSGDIYKTFGAGSQAQVLMALEGDSDQPIYSPMDLVQFMHSTVPWGFGLEGADEITQNDAHYLVFQPKYMLGKGNKGGFINPFNTWWTEETSEGKYAWMTIITRRNAILLDDANIDLTRPDVVAELLRNVVVFEKNGSDINFWKELTDESVLKIQSTGGIIPINLTMWGMSDTTSGTVSGTSIYGFKNVDLDTQGRNFNYMPLRIAIGSIDNTDPTHVSDWNQLAHLDCNLNDYYSVDPDQVTKIHDAMALSLHSDL